MFGNARDVGRNTQRFDADVTVLFVAPQTNKCRALLSDVRQFSNILRWLRRDARNAITRLAAACVEINTDDARLILIRALGTADVPLAEQVCCTGCDVFVLRDFLNSLCVSFGVGVGEHHRAGEQRRVWHSTCAMDRAGESNDAAHMFEFATGLTYWIA
jgi:hypothetical protein